MEKIALVTGSTNNVGKGIAQSLAEDGFLVIVTSRHGNKAKKVAEHMEKKGDSYEVDFSDTKQIISLFSLIKDKYGRLDVLVNNVAYTRNESLLECTPETWGYTLNVNLRSYYLCTQYAAEIMKQQGGGNIVNITISATGGIKNIFSYVVSKGGIRSLTLCAAVELAPFKIRVNAVGIAATGTPVGSKESPDRTRKYESPGIPAGHIGTPADIGHAVSFLVSDKASYIYGDILDTDGGSNISH